MYDLNGEATELELLAPAAPTSTATGTGVDITGYEGVIKISQHVGVVSGTLPTLDGTIETSDSVSTGYTAITGAAFTRVIATGSVQSLGVDVRACKKYIRYVGTIGGSGTPTFNVAVVAQGQKQYNA
jgi:hypothetical protein